MKVNLICSDNARPVLLELFSARNITLDDRAELCIAESGCTPPADKLCILFQPGNIFALVELLNKLTRVNEDSNKIIGRLGEERYKIIFYDQIDYFESRGNYTFCITLDGEYRVNEKLYELETRLPQDKFIRMGKSFIVNIENVKEIMPWFGRRLLLRFSGIKRDIEVSKNYVKSFKAFLGM